MIAEQAAAIGELKADMVALAAEVRDLRRRLGRNSGNSSMAPSADDLPGRTPPQPKPAPLLRAGRLKYREDIVDGLDNAPAAFIGLLQGRNFGKLLVRLAADPTLSGGS